MMTDHLTIKELIELSKERSLTEEAQAAFLERQKQRSEDEVDLTRLLDEWLEKRYDI